MPIVFLRHALAPLTAGLLLAACTASSDSNATPANLAVAGTAAMTAAPQPASEGHDDPAADHDPDDLDGFDDDDDLGDTVDMDPAELVRRQLAQQPARRGSAGPVQACTLSGRVTIAGHTEDIRDCMQSNGSLSVAEFQQACQGLANGLNQTGNAPAKIEYSNRCPTPAQGSCRNFMNSGMDAFYYQRTDLAPLPGSCAATGGRWQAGG
ncbi:hypothetical protein ABXT00_00950 [Stenotrophomonas koreensis]|uniref:hypothetical protein n=1 Tax=Stenotrophomonas koreensis TaxID=266128 RepID=UPI0033971723